MSLKSLVGLCNEPATDPKIISAAPRPEVQWFRAIAVGIEAQRAEHKEKGVAAS
jgi:hypothetical protein